MYQLVVFLHVLAAAVWVGGMLFLALVVVPATRELGLVPERREALFTAIGRRFRPVGWGCVAVLVATGALNLWYRGVDLFAPTLPTSSFGQILLAKLGAVAVMVAVTAYHDFVLGPASARSHENAAVLRRRSQLSARVGAGLGLLSLWLAVLLVRGLPS